MIKEPHWKVHYTLRMPMITSLIVQVTPKDLIIKYHTEGSACRIENVRFDRLKTGLNLDKIEDDIEEDGMNKPQLPRGDEIPRGESRSSWEGNLLESRDYLVV